MEKYVGADETLLGELQALIENFMYEAVKDEKDILDVKEVRGFLYDVMWMPIWSGMANASTCLELTLFLGEM